MGRVPEASTGRISLSGTEEGSSEGHIENTGEDRAGLPAVWSGQGTPSLRTSVSLPVQWGTSGVVQARIGVRSIPGQLWPIHDLVTQVSVPISRPIADHLLFAANTNLAL